MSDVKRILIISEAHLIKTFVQATVKKIREGTNARFDCFITSPIDEKTREALSEAFDHVFVNEYPKGIIGKLPKIRVLQAILGLRGVAKKLPDYDIVHIHYHHYYFALFAPIIRRKTKKFYLTFFGGDFDEVSNFKHWFNQRSVNLLDSVFAINEVMLQNISNRYNLVAKGKKSGILRLLMNNFVSFGTFLNNHTISSAKMIWGIEKKIIVCAYSAGIVMRHEMIIDALNKVKDKLHDYKMIFPMTYGWKGEVRRAIVKEKLKTASFDSLVLEDFLTVEKLQALRLAADIFINVPSRDQAASSFLEHLAAGSVVITGSWLPYSSLADMGMYFVIIDSPDELPGMISSVIDHLKEHKEKSRVNREIVLNMMSWDSIKTNWYQHYELNEGA